MKTIGILGGMSASSTQIYYRELCNLMRDHFGGLCSPELLIRSLDFARIEGLQTSGKWDEAAQILNKEEQALERGGAGLIVLATNTTHKPATQMMISVSIPMLHIADATAASIRDLRLRSPGLMATAFTMELAVYVDRLIAAGLTPILPDDTDRAWTHRIIYEELCCGTVREESQEIYISIANRLMNKGACSSIATMWPCLYSILH